MPGSPSLATGAGGWTSGWRQGALLPGPQALEVGGGLLEGHGESEKVLSRPKAPLDQFPTPCLCGG